LKEPWRFFGWHTLSVCGSAILTLRITHRFDDKVMRDDYSIALQARWVACQFGLQLEKTAPIPFQTEIASSLQMPLNIKS
jgi:hypothetical protein